MNKIAELLNRKRADIAQRKVRPLAQVPEDDRRMEWNKNEFRIIPEIKRTSLSAGAIRPDLDVIQLARSYELSGAAAISVLTEEHYFHGSLRDLSRVRKEVSIPLLQKDFILDEFQIPEAKESGADFVLLIARFLTSEQIGSMLRLCDQIQINAIVEITDETDLQKIEQPVRYLGVNSRDLETLRVDTTRFEKIRPLLPSAYWIAESGIDSFEALKRVVALGYHGALIGEHFLRATEPSQELRQFVRAVSRTKVKICGITNQHDAQLAVEAGASALGFIFAQSPRSISPQTLRKFRNTIDVPCVGVFRGNSQEEIKSIVDECKLDIAQIYDRSSAPITTWQAETVTSVEALRQNKNFARNRLIDIKVSEPDLAKAWMSLADGSVFALAGGLHAGNVSQAVSLCRPEWVDVARGVESQPGIKDEYKLHEFMKNCLITAEGAERAEDLVSPPPSPRSALNKMQLPDAKGYFGNYGGRFVPETLMEALLKLERDYARISASVTFQTALSKELREFAGRPTPLYFAKRLSERLQIGPIYLKREDLCHTGAHKINNCVGQALFAAQLGKNRIVAETGAGQHGVATAATCARLGLQCVVYMGAKDMKRQELNVRRMKYFGSEVRCVTQGSQTLKDAINEALRDWISNVDSTHYLIGSVVGPHPYPMIVRNFQKIIGEETIRQLHSCGESASLAIACVGGGSNAMGLFYPFLDFNTRLIGVEAGGSTHESGHHSATLTHGRPGILHGAYTYLLQRPQGQIEDTESIAPGLDYAAVGPEHSYLKDTGRVQYVTISDQHALKAFRTLADSEGILAALESCHAIAYLENLKLQNGATVVNLSGRGDKDLGIVAEEQPA